MTSAAVILKAFPKVQSTEPDMLARIRYFELFEKLPGERRQTSLDLSLRFEFE